MKNYLYEQGTFIHTALFRYCILSFTSEYLGTRLQKKVTFNILDVGKALDLMDFVFIT